MKTCFCIYYRSQRLSDVDEEIVRPFVGEEINHIDLSDNELTNIPEWSVQTFHDILTEP